MNKIQVVMPSMPPYEEFIEEIRDLWESRWLTHTGPKHQQLEEKLAEYLGVTGVSVFSNGHMALELGLEALGLSGEVITTPFTFSSTTQAIVRNGLTPVFCDIKENDYTIDPAKIEALITDKTTAILGVHVYGNLCDVDGIQRIAEDYGLKVIYDGAHAFGITVNGKGVGTFGDLTMFSFHATKVFHTVEGGGLAYADEGFKKRFVQLRQFGMEGIESVPTIGTNAKMTEMHAAMGLCNLRHIDEEIEKRKSAALRYREHLQDIKGLRLCTEVSSVKSNYSYFPVLFDEKVFGKSRDEVMEALAAENIFARRYYYPLTSQFDCYKGRFPIQETPVAERIAENILALPLYADLELKDVDRICGILLR